MERDWIEKLSRDYRLGLLSYLRHHTDSLEDAQDLCQDVFLNCWRYRENFDKTKCDERAWLYIIARNRLKNYYRDKENTISLDELEYDMPSGTDEIAQAVFLMEIREELALVLKRLDERSRRVVILRYFQEKSYGEIAGLMGIQEGAARMIHQRALKKIRLMLKL